MPKAEIIELFFFLTLLPALIGFAAGFGAGWAQGRRRTDHARAHEIAADAVRETAETLVRKSM